MKREIVGFERDEDSAWVARLACGHTQHVRHRPPLEERPWVLSGPGRRSKIGTQLECPFCLMPALPSNVKPYKMTPVFDEQSVPAGLLKDHQTRAGTWGVIIVLEGKLLYQIAGGQSWVLRPGIDGIIEPTVAHSVRPIGAVRFQVEFHRP